MDELQLDTQARAVAHQRGQRRLPPQLLATLATIGASPEAIHCVIDLWDRSEPVQHAGPRTLVVPISAQAATVHGGTTVRDAADALVDLGLLDPGPSDAEAARWSWLVDDVSAEFGARPSGAPLVEVSEVERDRLHGLIMGR